MNNLKLEFNNERDIYVSAYESDNQVGCVDARLVLDEIQINDVFVDDSHRHQGIASEMFNRLLEFAREHSCKKISLEVRADNEVAQALYSKFGFIQVGLRKDFYSNPTDDAILMDLNL